MDICRIGNASLECRRSVEKERTDDASSFSSLAIVDYESRDDRHGFRARDLRRRYLTPIVCSSKRARPTD